MTKQLQFGDLAASLVISNCLRSYKTGQKAAVFRGSATRSAGTPDEDMCGAAMICDDPADLMERFNHSPLAKR